MEKYSLMTEINKQMDSTFLITATIIKDGSTFTAHGLHQDLHEAENIAVKRVKELAKVK